MNHTTKAVWQTRAGFMAAINQTPLGHLCGYVQVPVGHPAYGHADEYDTPLNQIGCHGGITYAEFNNNDYPIAETEKGHYWIGFDCGHFGDGRDSEAVETYFKHAAKGRPYPQDIIDSFKRGHVWTVNEVIDECESIATQLKDMHS